MNVSQTKAWLEQAGVHPSHRMGQNFLTDPSALSRIAARALAVSTEWILEIGAGPGNLTEHLLEPDRRVVALERDRRLARLCASRLASSTNLTVIAADALSCPVRKFLPRATISVAGNIPYSITGKIIKHIGEELRCVERAVLLVQKEAARRLTAGPGEEGYGGFTILTRAKWNVQRDFGVPAASFYPRPEVDSELIVLERPKDPPVKPALYPLVRRLVHEAFQRRRKTLANAIGPFFDSLKPFGEVQHVIMAAGLDPKQRPETVPLEGWVLMAQALRGVVR